MANFTSIDNYTRYIFDLDYTTLIPDWSKEDAFLEKRIPKEQHDAFFKNKQRILDLYEMTFPRYDVKTLSEFFANNGLTVSEQVIYDWMVYNGKTIVDEVAPGAIHLFQYLKENNKTMGICTSWFGETQMPRLSRSGVKPYCDFIITGDMAMKPSLLSMYMAMGNTPKGECIMIGDSERSDLAAAQAAGIDCFLVSSNNTLSDFESMLRQEKESTIILARK